MATQLVSVSLPDQLIEELDTEARKESRSRDEIVEEATRYYLRKSRWRGIQAVVSRRGREMGLETEDDIEELVDSIKE